MAEPQPPPSSKSSARESNDSTSADDARRYLTIDELSARTTLSVSTLRRLYRRGQLVGYQPGGPRTRIVFPPDAIEQAVQATATALVPRPSPPLDPMHAPGRGPRPQWMQHS